MFKVDRKQILAYRLYAQQLGERAPTGELVGVAGRCCPQNTPPGSAALALGARVEGVSERRVGEELEEGKRLLQAFGARAAPHVFPVREAAVFTRGLLPEGEEELRAFLRGAVPALDRLGLGAGELVELTVRAVEEVLDGIGLVKDEAGRAVGELIGGRLPEGMQEGWKGGSPYAGKQFLGESLVRFALPVVSLRGVLCHGGREGRSPLLRRTDQWVGRVGGVMKAPGELVRWFLRCYGPAGPGELAGWGGIGVQQAERLWAGVEAELVEVGFQAGRLWVLAGEEERLRSAGEVRGVRMVPPHDPYLQARDRGVLVPDRERQKVLWRRAGSPGAVLVDGEVRGVWRAKVRGRKLDVSVEALGEIGRGHRGAVEEEVGRVAACRGLEVGKVGGW
ncbi:winged helix DNA-binding domain-containing protein [Nonomuraea sp. NPDC050328]|uniref:winged helix DNA-binding domain-containing protein n=1 Tax=Nonomuraea sp. NPDC050328 TaxID=3364361 RepID=UPI0037B9646B